MNIWDELKAIRAAIEYLHARQDEILTKFTSSKLTLSEEDYREIATVCGRASATLLYNRRTNIGLAASKKIIDEIMEK